MAAEVESVKSIGLRVLERFPDIANTRFWLMLNINNSAINAETRKHLSALLKECHKLIPVGNARVARLLREEARDGKESIALLPSAERQQVIDQEEEIYYEEYSKKKKG